MGKSQSFRTEMESDALRREYLIWAGLLLNIFFNDIDRNSSTTAGKITGSPQGRSPKLGPYFGVIFSSDHSRRHALEEID